MAHDVGHLIISAVIHALHRVKDAALYGFQAVLDMGNGTVEDAVTGVVKEPVLVHPAQMMYSRCVEAVHGLIVGMAFYTLFRLLHFQNLVVLYFVVHSYYGL